MSFGFGLSFPAWATLSGRGFSPLSLFSSGEQGAWYDPSDLLTLFSDSAGTTPVAAPGAGASVPVGLILDKSRGLVLGSELVTNGTFDTDVTGWTATNSTVTWDASERALVTASGTTAAFVVSGAVATVIGKTYIAKITFAKGTVTSNTAYIGISNNSTGGGAYITSPVSGFGNGTQQLVFTATAATTYIYGRWETVGTGLTFYIDDVSIRELPGNHAYQTSTSPDKRPTLAARYNLLQRTEDFSVSPWGGLYLTVTANAGTAPNGTNTATQLDTSSANSPYRTQTFAAAATTYKASFYVKAVNHNFVAINFSDGATFNYYVSFSLAGSGSVLRKDSQVINETITSVGDGWFLITASLTYASAAGSANVGLFLVASDGTKQAISIGQKILAWGADLRVANESSALPPYQRVVDALTYDTTGFPYYLLFDGSNDALVTNSIDFTATDKMSVFAGVRKLSDAAVGQLVELSAGISNGGIAGAFSMPASDGGAIWGAGVRGNGSVATVSATALAAPITTINTSLMDLSLATGDLRYRINAQSVGSSTTDTGGGNFGNYPLYIGARNNASLWFNGRLHSLIVLGRGVTATELTQTEGYVETKTFGKDMSYVYTDELLGPDGEQLTVTAGGDALFMTVSYE